VNKLALAIATTVLTVMTIFSPAAEAGMKTKLGFGGPLPHFTAYSNAPSYNAKKQRGRHVRKSRATKKTVAKPAYKAKKSTVSKAANEPKAVKSVATTEQSSISSETGDAATKPEVAQNVVGATRSNEPETSREVGCKKFFPSVAMTLTVPCE